MKANISDSTKEARSITFGYKTRTYIFDDHFQRVNYHYCLFFHFLCWKSWQKLWETDTRLVPWSSSRHFPVAATWHPKEARPEGSIFHQRLGAFATVMLRSISLRGPLSCLSKAPLTAPVNTLRPNYPTRFSPILEVLNNPLVITLVAA